MRGWWQAFRPATHALVFGLTSFSYMVGGLIYADSYKVAFTFIHPYGALATACLVTFVYGLAGTVGTDCWDCPRKDKEIRALRDALKETHP